MTRKALLSFLVAMVLILSMAMPALADIAPGTPVKGGTLTISDYFDPPPAIHGNPLTPSGIGGAREFIFDRLVEFAPVPTESYLYFIAVASSTDGNKTTVLLNKDAKWSDGTPLTAKDVVTTYNMRYLMSDSVWQYLTKVEAIDDHTVVFEWNTFSPLLPRMAYNLHIEMAYENYGKWADDAASHQSKRVFDEVQMRYVDSKEIQDALTVIKEDFFTYLPDITTIKTSGAYRVESVNANEMMLTKNEYYYNADNVFIDKVRIQRYVSAEAYLTTVMNGGYDSEPHGLTPDLFKQLEANNPAMKTMWVPDLGQPAFQFNITKKPLDKAEVRQAIGYVIDRELLLDIAEPGTMPGDYYASGLTPLWRDAYMTDELKAQMNEYRPDFEKADALLTSIGWTKGADGYWQDETGETVNIEVASMNSWPIFFACGEAASLMLDEYGIKSTFNAMELSSYWKYIDDGSSMINCDFRGGTTQRGPWEAYSSTYLWSNSRIGLNPQGSPTDMPMVLKMTDGTEVNVRAELTKMFYGTEEENAAAVITMMKLTNDQVFILPIGEKYAPMKIHNPKLGGYPLDGNSPLWYMGHMRAYSRLLKSGALYFTE